LLNVEGTMEAFRLEIVATDRETADAVRELIAELRSAPPDTSRPAGVTILPDPSDELEALDPFTIAFLVGVAGGVGKKVGERIAAPATEWVAAAVQQILKRRGRGSVTLKRKEERVSLSAETSEQEVKDFAQRTG
jgi:hypothetical protein